MNLKFSICCWNVVQAAIDPVEIDVRPESVTVSHDLVRADHVTILYFQINLPVTGRCLLFQFDKRRFAFIVKVRLWVKVVDLPPSFQISQSNNVWTFVQKQHHCVHSQVHGLWRGVGEDEHLQFVQAVVLKDVQDVLVNDPVDRSDELHHLQT